MLKRNSPRSFSQPGSIYRNYHLPATSTIKTQETLPTRVGRLGIPVRGSLVNGVTDFTQFKLRPSSFTHTTLIEVGLGCCLWLALTLLDALYYLLQIAFFSVLRVVRIKVTARISGFKLLHVFSYNIVWIVTQCSTCVDPIPSNIS